MMTTADIKNFSISLEALSRMPGVESLSIRIQGLLTEAIAEQEEKSTRTPVYSRPPIRPAPARIDDDIPF